MYSWYAIVLFSVMLIVSLIGIFLGFHSAYQTYDEPHDNNNTETKQKTYKKLHLCISEIKFRRQNDKQLKDKIHNQDKMPFAESSCMDTSKNYDDILLQARSQQDASYEYIQSKSSITLERRFLYARFCSQAKKYFYAYHCIIFFICTYIFFCVGH